MNDVPKGRCGNNNGAKVGDIGNKDSNGIPDGDTEGPDQGTHGPTTDHDGPGWRIYTKSVHVCVRMCVPMCMRMSAHMSFSSQVCMPSHMHMQMSTQIQF